MDAKVKPETAIYAIVFLLCLAYFIFPQYQKDAVGWIGTLTPFGNELGFVGWILFGLAIGIVLIFGAVALVLYGFWSGRDISSIKILGVQPWGALDGLEKSLDSFHLDATILVICAAMAYFGALALDSKTGFDAFGKGFGSVLVAALGLFFLIKLVLSALGLEEKANEFFYSFGGKH